MEMIQFNKPYLGGAELENIQKLFGKGTISGDGHYTKKCIDFFKTNFNFTHNYLTTSATDALEMAAILLDIKPGDEVIMPSFTFPSTANAFLLRGAKIVFADSHTTHPNLDEGSLEELITSKTKVIVPIHYAGVACDMDKINTIAQNYSIAVVEDAAQAISSHYKGKPLGALGDFGVISFHETKNITCGEGGLLIIKNKEHAARAEFISEKGTNRSSFFRGEIDKYGWVDVGSSFLPSDILSAILYAQLEQLASIQKRRIAIWNKYNVELQDIKKKGIELPFIPEYGEVNGHLFYLICPSLDIRSSLISFLRENMIKSVFHYQPLHQSKYYLNTSELRPQLSQAIKYGDQLVRLPLHVNLTDSQQNYVIEKVIEFCNSL